MVTSFQCLAFNDENLADLATLEGLLEFATMIEDGNPEFAFFRCSREVGQLCLLGREEINEKRQNDKNWTFCFHYC
jgi:hypothetical protein